MQQNVKNILSIIFYLISCVLHNEKPDENKLIGIDLELLYNIAKKHSLVGIIYMALDGTSIFSRGKIDVIKKWKEQKEMLIRKSILLDVERKQILNEMESKHIWYMPLKGCVIKHFYPSEWMREMSDIDILFDKSYQSEVKNIFKSRKYKAILYNISNHDIYEKKPFYNFEMHTSLFSHIEYPKPALYYDNIQDKLLKDKKTIYGRHFSDEDYYVYMTVHAYKHYNGNGTGLRTIVDFYVMYMKFCHSVDWTYISNQLEGIINIDFEIISKNLVRHLLDKMELIDIDSLTIEEQKMLEYYFLSGTYGTLDNHVRKDLRKFADNNKIIDSCTKMKYYMWRIFPGREWCKEKFPLMYRYPILLPFFWVYRVIRVLIFKRKKIKYEMQIIKKVSNL